MAATGRHVANARVGEARKAPKPRPPQGRFTYDEMTHAVEAARELIEDQGYSLMDACKAIAEEVGVAGWQTVRNWSRKGGRTPLPYGANYAPITVSATPVHAKYARGRARGTASSEQLADSADPEREPTVGEKYAEQAQYYRYGHEGEVLSDAPPDYDEDEEPDNYDQDNRLRLSNRLFHAVKKSIRVAVHDPKAMKDLATAYAILVDKRRIEEGSGTGAGRPDDEDDPLTDLDKIAGEGSRLLRVLNPNDEQVG